MKFMALIERLLDTPAVIDFDQRRRARLLNILLLSVGILTLLASVGTVVMNGGIDLDSTQPLLIIASAVFLLIVAVVYFLNRKGFVTLASSLFLIFLVLILAFSDTPQEVIEGRTLFLFALPVLIASVILRPSSSFILALLVSVVLTFVALTAGLSLSLTVVMGFFALAVVSWLSANTLERALTDLREINQDLDKRVEARTAELKITNSLLEEQIVERQRAAEALRIARDQALDASRFKTELLAKVSHELRTPLGVILGFAEMMTAGIYGPVTDTQHDVLTKIIERDKRLTQLVGDLLDQSQFETGHIKLKEKPYNLAHILDNVSMSLQELADEKGVELSTELDEALPQILLGDNQRIEQIIVNLTNNALKFTKEGYVHVSAYRINDEEWGIEVEDTGIGIPDKAQRYIFEAFRQVDGSATRHHEGFGLGLSIVKQITDAMGGRINLESQVGKGSIFTVTLPLVAVTVEENVV